MKRKQASPDDDPLQAQETTPRKRRTVTKAKQDITTTESAVPSTPSTRLRSRSKATLTNSPVVSPSVGHKTNPLFSTPTKTPRTRKIAEKTPSRTRNADRSAKKKSAGILLDSHEDNAWDGSEKLAREIWDIQEEGECGDEADDIQPGENLPEQAEHNLNGITAGEQLKKQTKSRVSRRTPTPEGDLPPHERYFFQNRLGPVLTSDNTLSKLTLLTHEEYFDRLEQQPDRHSTEKAALLEIHARSFPQWNFELDEGFNICLYGYGSKRNLLLKFAEWLYEWYRDPPTIVIVNGYSTTITLRSILTTIVNAILGPDAPSKLGTQPTEILDFLQTNLSTKPPKGPVFLLLNSIDASPVRRQSSQAALARLASMPYINVVCTADTPNFLLLWDIGLRAQFNFVFHDCTTFAPYNAELNVVDEVHSLLGRKIRRIGGKQGIGFVLKSLPDNTRKLYRLLITELLTTMGDQQGSEGEEEPAPQRDNAGNGPKDAAIEWRTLFHKATEEFISSSELMFRTQLKEFYDHQMILSRTDVSGVEMLGAPLSQEEMESVLEDLV